MITTRRFRRTFWLALLAIGVTLMMLVLPVGPWWSPTLWLPTVSLAIGWMAWWLVALHRLWLQRQAARVNRPCSVSFADLEPAPSWPWRPVLPAAPPRLQLPSPFRPADQLAPPWGEL